MQKAVAKANKSIYIIVHELEEQKREHQEEEDTFLPLEMRDLNEEQFTSLRKLTASRIASWAQSGRLTNHPYLLPILYAWRDFGDVEACKQFVRELTTTDRGLIAFLMAILDQPITQAMTEYKKDPSWENYLNDIKAFIAINILEEHAKLLFEDSYFEKLREKEQLAIMIFLDLTHAKTKKIIPKTTV